MKWIPFHADGDVREQWFSDMLNEGFRLPYGPTSRALSARIVMRYGWYQSSICFLVTNLTESANPGGSRSNLVVYALHSVVHNALLPEAPAGSSLICTSVHNALTRLIKNLGNGRERPWVEIFVQVSPTAKENITSCYRTWYLWSEGTRFAV